VVVGTTLLVPAAPAEVPPGVVTVTVTLPGDPGGEVAVHVVADEHETPVAAAVPKSTVVEPTTKPVPVMVITVPPIRGPASGVTEVTEGMGSKVNWSSEEITEVPQRLDTVMSTVAADSAGSTAVIWVSEFTTKLEAGLVPKFTALAAENSVPVITTEVPEAKGPASGAMPVTVGLTACGDLVGPRRGRPGQRGGHICDGTDRDGVDDVGGRGDHGEADEGEGGHGVAAGPQVLTEGTVGWLAAAGSPRKGITTAASPSVSTMLMAQASHKRRNVIRSRPARVIMRYGAVAARHISSPCARTAYS